MDLDLRYHGIAAADQLGGGVLEATAQLAQGVRSIGKGSGAPLPSAPVLAFLPVGAVPPATATDHSRAEERAPE